MVGVEYISRKDLGWPASAAPKKTKKTKGVKIHYEGVRVPSMDHSKCKAHWTDIRKSHLANTKENYSDVAYNYAVCQHGSLLEGRGLGHRTGANGSAALNEDHDAIVVLVGTEYKTVTPKVIEGLKEGIKRLRASGTGNEIKGHRDGYATACPGDALYALVKAGKLEPGKPVTAKPKPIYAPFPGAGFFKVGTNNPLVTAMGKRLVAEGYKGYKVGPGPKWTEADRLAYAWWQRKLGYGGKDADGIPGKTSWDRLKVPK
jgi:hypothetical protein